MDRTTTVSAAAAALGALAAGLATALGLGTGGVASVLAAATGALVAGLAAGPVAAARTARSAGPAREASSPATPAALPAGYGRYLLDRVPVGVLVVQPDGAIGYANPVAARLFDLRQERQHHVAALRAPRLLEIIEAALETGHPGEVGFSLVRGGDVHLHAIARPLAPAGAAETVGAAGAARPASAGGGAGVLVVLEDRTQVRRAEELHRDFVANASHELKTPLASISGIIETLAGPARDDPAATERFLKLMAEQAERMKALVRDLLSLNRIEINERIRPEEPQPVRRIARETAEGFRRQAEEAGMTIEADPAADAPLVRGDRGELVQLFSNLIDNAIKYGRPGTAVTVRAVENRGRIGIAVGDRGSGIAREHIPRLTERFYRVSVDRSRAKGGTGLGLAIVKHIANRHRGTLSIESVPGEGSTFTVWLPVVPGSESDDADSPGH